MSTDDPQEKGEYEQLMDDLAKGRAELVGEHHPTAAANVLELYRTPDADDPTGFAYLIVMKDVVPGENAIAGYSSGADGMEAARLSLRAVAATADLEIVARKAVDVSLGLGAVGDLATLVKDLEGAVDLAWNALNRAEPEPGGRRLE